jgi:hypothetical protein
VWDELLIELIHVFRQDLGDARQALIYVQQVESSSARFDAFVAGGRLKDAYLLAIKTPTPVPLIIKIRDIASSTNNLPIISLCESFLRGNT